MTKTNPFYMPGTEGTGEYIVLAHNARGRIGVRVLEGDPMKVTSITAARVRVEPSEGPKVLAQMAEVLSPKKGWKQPGDNGQQRFSTFFEGSSKVLKNRIARAMAALRVDGVKTTVNPDAPQWAKDMVAALS